MDYKKLLILLSIITVPLLFADFTYKKVSGSHPGSTGAPGDLTCAQSGCHLGSVIQNDNTVNSLVFPTIDSTYVPGQTYLVKLKTNNPTIQRFGFEIVALKDATNKNVGTWTITQTTRTQIISHSVAADTRYSVTHKQAGTVATPSTGLNEWQFNWTAPAINEGPITFYYATNSTNNNGSNSGDQIRTSSFKIKPAFSSTIDELVNENEVTAFYNSNEAAIDLKYNLEKDEKIGITIFDVSGKKMYSKNLENKTKGIHTTKIAFTTEISPGVYFIHLLIGNTKHTKKIFIQ